MNWRVIRQPDGKYARFSDIVDDFTHFDLTREEILYTLKTELCMTREDANSTLIIAEQNPARWDAALVARLVGKERAGFVTATSKIQTIVDSVKNTK